MLDRYLDYRIARRLRTTSDPGRYRGLEPASKLILTHKGYKYHLNTKRRVSWAGDQCVPPRISLDAPFPAWVFLNQIVHCPFINIERVGMVLAKKEKNA